ncbi:MULTISPECIES: PHP domain-containing protein [unclassified Solwaraspora]|uniref:PHP domain-containing protein n=1 Tax=unclassified Solwaraspora TaxID=2627926 RepID=UPI00259BA030|nr:PHP domain-containing protein [Solwaraspora sp. WMMA2056]WJK38239.1 PHP domain-containing protein [Solwaraspora sp. WMMA2056]
MAADVVSPDPQPHPDTPGTGDVSRRGFLRGAGAVGLGAAAAGPLTAGQALTAAPAAAGTGAAGRDRPPRAGYHWLAGDHHVHSQFSVDGIYRVRDLVRQARAYGLDWLVLADHGRDVHASAGAQLAAADIAAVRRAVGDMLVFQGLEWNIPAAEHGTVFVHPGPDDLAVLREFESRFDADVLDATGAATPDEDLALAGLRFLGEAVDRRRVRDALFIGNHPARRGLNTPHELRRWRDTRPDVAIGFEGAPGHQAAGIAAPFGLGMARGLYYLSATDESFAGYPRESYRTWGGFDWMTATVGGVWDSLLAEGRPWWITASSDAHSIYADPAITGPDSDFHGTGRHADPVYGGAINPWTFDFWPGYYSRTHVGADRRSYAAVMAGLRAGRIWVDHGGLIDSLDVRAVAGRRWATLGDTLTVRSGSRVELTISVDLAQEANWAQFVPRLARVDVIRGAVTGPAADLDTRTAPQTSVVESFEVTASTGTVTFRYDLGHVTEPCYLRVRGTDGNRSAPGYLGAAVDPAGPAMDLEGSADPWTDLWFYSNPIWVRPGR